MNGETEKNIRFRESYMNKGKIGSLCMMLERLIHIETFCIALRDRVTTTHYIDIYPSLAVSFCTDTQFSIFMVMRACFLRLWTFALLQVPIQASQGVLKFKIQRLDYLNGQCCKLNCGTTKRTCTTYFDVCLKDSLSSKSDPCVIEKTSSKGVTNVTKELDVGLQSSYNKPMILILRGKSQTGQILFEITDDKLLTFTNSTWHQLQAKTHAFHVNIEYKLSCRPNYYGRNCQKICQPRSDPLGYYNCDKFGNRVCHAGWRGSYCTKRTCIYTCIHGNCDETSSPTCACRKGWRGMACEIDMKLCHTRPCLNGGICSSNGKCMCKNGYYGSRCEKNLVSTSSMARFDSSIPAISMTSQYRYTVTSPYTSLFYSIHSQLPNESIAQKQTVTNQSKFTAPKSTRKHLTVCKHSFLTSGTLMQTIAYHSSYHSSTPGISIKHSTHLPITSSIASSLTPVTPTKPTEKSIVLPLVIVSVLVFLIFSLIAFWFLWKRSKFRRRRSQTHNATPSKNDYKNYLRSVPSTNSVSTATSVSPILKKCYDTDSGTGLESHDVDIISVIDYPVPLNDVNEQNSYDVEKYTIKAVDQICWEVINGSKPLWNDGSKTKRQRQEGLLLNKELHTKRKSQTSSAYSSSGYCSSTASPKPGSATSHQTIRSYASQCFSPEDVYSLALAYNSSEQNNNNHFGITSMESGNNNQSSEVVGQLTEFVELVDHVVDHVDTESKQDSFSQNKPVYESVTFEGLPNFVTY